MLTILDHLPPGFLDLDATRLHEILPDPALIHLPGRRPEPVFVSMLLHGNEDTGLRAMQALLREYQDRELPRALSIFTGNVSAARFGLRRLDGQPDYNRIWPGGEPGDSPEHAMMRDIVDIMRARRVFASIDIHNNTGLNPHYACVNRLDDAFLHLATLFGRTVVYFLRPTGVQSMAFAELCPSVTIECGQPGQDYGIEHAREFVEACLHLAELPAHPVAAHDIDLFHTVAIVTVPPMVSFGFGEADTELRLLGDLDYLNFRELPAGTLLGWARTGSPAGLAAHNEAGEDVSARYFIRDGGEIRTARRVMPSMLTLDTRVIRQDCLCYFMERLGT